MVSDRQRNPKEDPGLAAERDEHARGIIGRIFGQTQRTPQPIRYPLEWCEAENQGECGLIGDCLYQCGQPIK